MAKNGITDVTRWEKQILQIYPPTTEPAQHTLITTVVLISCTLMGTCGNASQVCLQWYTKRFSIKNEDQSCTLFQFKEYVPKTKGIFPITSFIFAAGFLAVSLPFLYLIKVTETVLYEELGNDPNTLLQVITSSCSARYLSSMLTVANGSNFVIEFLVPLATILKISGSATPHWFNILLENCDLLLPGINASISWIPARYLSSYYVAYTSLDGPSGDTKLLVKQSCYHKSNTANTDSRKCQNHSAEKLPNLESHSHIEDLTSKAGMELERTNSLPTSKRLRQNDVQEMKTRP
ncbi:unnamed protein product [Enterobius vermicularis]|uniref:Anoctamin n=1 Tax=Enterobius vermicularis TaxID=51028 RepID=A0A0N4VMQ1_ENTVE|nr:unnamed protein product [Enterobius vermicularis]